MKKFGLSLIFILLICNLGCEKTAQSQINTSSPTKIKNFSVKMERRLSIGPCFSYILSVDSVGKVYAERKCMRQIEPAKCHRYESNRISTEKRPCFKDEVEKLERKLSDSEIETLRSEIEKSKFFSFEADYSFMSKNCSQVATDTPSVNLNIKIDDKEKTINHFHGCFVKTLFGNENALQPLKNLENKIDEVVGTKNWIEGN